MFDERLCHFKDIKKGKDLKKSKDFKKGKDLKKGKDPRKGSMLSTTLEGLYAP